MSSDEHFPWAYTPHGVICVCGAPCRDEECTAQRPSTDTTGEA